MFIETSSPRLPNDKARFESEEFQPTGSSGRCLKFWYHMYGSTIGSLNVWMSSNGSTGMIWTLFGNQNNQWNYAQAPVSSKNVYQVSTAMPHKYGTIANHYETLPRHCAIMPIHYHNVTHHCATIPQHTPLCHTIILLCLKIVIHHCFTIPHYILLCHTSVLLC